MKTQESLDARMNSAEPPYRSEAEARIGRMLDSHGIPFFYQQPRLIYDCGTHDIWRPTYTLPTYDSLVAEYADPATGLDYAQRQRSYQANSIAAVMVSPADMAMQGWERNLHLAIDSAYEHAQRNWYVRQMRES